MRRTLALVVVGALVTVGTAVGSSGSVGASPVPQTFAFTGAAQFFVVPANVSAIRVDAFGAQGGAYDEAFCESGGFGAEATATVAVTPGEVLEVMVGGRGSRYPSDANWQAGGFNGGGDGVIDTVAGSRGGGGASDVRRVPYALADRLVVAGGGGGAGSLNGGSVNGGAGGAPKGSDGSPNPNGGAGGTQSAGGAAGVTEGTADATVTAGQLGQGGAGGRTSGIGAFSGGGGGGGLYGGGGAGGRSTSPGAGGGGGSSFGPPGTTFVTGARGRSGDCTGPGPLPGDVTITYDGAVAQPAGTFHPLDPTRLFDTRQTGKVAGGTTLAVDVLGQKGVPVSGVDAVVMNVTVTEPDGPGYVTVFPCGQNPPTASNLNYDVGQNVPISSRSRWVPMVRCASSHWPPRTFWPTSAVGTPGRPAPLERGTRLWPPVASSTLARAPRLTPAACCNSLSSDNRASPRRG
jgi:hypothetical protein